MKQSDLGLNLTTKRTRKREFLAQMERVVPWCELMALVAIDGMSWRRFQLATQDPGQTASSSSPESSQINDAAFIYLDNNGRINSIFAANPSCKPLSSL